MAEVSTNNGQTLPYVMAYGNIKKTLDKVITAATPDRFTQDFLATKLGVKGGAAKAVIPFMKRIGFLASDGTPTAIYNQFRTEGNRGNAAFKALHQGYNLLYEMNEYAHDLSDNELKDLVTQATGSAAGSSTSKSIVGSFKALKEYADTSSSLDDQLADAPTDEDAAEEQQSFTQPKTTSSSKLHESGLRLGYTINLNLPATADISVYNAIFKSLKEHLLDE